MANVRLCLISLGIIGGITECLCESILVNEGSSALLSCINKPIDGKLVTVRWGKDDGIVIAQKNVSRVEHYVIEGKYFIDDEMKYLKIDNIEPSDQGEYTCTAEIDGEKVDKNNILQHTITLQVNTSHQVIMGNATNGEEKETGGSFQWYIIIVVIVIVALVIIFIVVTVVLIRRRKATQRVRRRSSRKTDQIYKPVTSNQPPSKRGRKARNKDAREGYAV
ncbi:uncharacterized protein [Ptychodera flava]|uniref:uncharacterized protein n=1 Tax=Ptychodera flava TaxID=63121 RepID=UPI00396A70C9